jgi:pimeloyl-ACP methyl ester carboxylesterase
LSLTRRVPSRRQLVEQYLGLVQILCALLATFALKPKGLADSRYVRQTSGAPGVIVFIHGVLGNGTSTWTAPNKAYWPEMLTKDSTFTDFDIYVCEYPTTMAGSTFSIDEIADHMRLFFDADGVSTHRELIFVAHSMGGLALRAYLTKYRNVAPRTRFIYFYSTPTTGSEIASLASLISANPHLAEMRPMQSVDYLADLQRQWLAADLGIASYCAYEKRRTYGISVVTQASASNLCNKRLDPIDEDHITIVKPSDMRHPSYLALKSALSQTPPLRASEEKAGDETDVAIRVILSGCHRRALFTRMHAQLSQEAMFSSIQKCREIVGEQIPRIRSNDLQNEAMELLAAVEGIERMKAAPDFEAINKLKLAALHSFRKLAELTHGSYPLPESGKLAEAVYFTQAEADAPLDIGDLR